MNTLASSHSEVYINFVKPFFDKAGSLVLLLILSPFILIVMMLILFGDGRPLWFLQVRPGKDCKPFTLIKFRTMSAKTDHTGQLLSDAQRLTRVGRWIRKTSMDEVPQLINVLKGDMSIVGPRPLLTEYVDLYDDVQIQRHNVKPGITGWAQVNGRNTVEWKKRFEYDVWYVRNISFALDLKILLRTLVSVLKAEGISGSNSATMEKFRGNS
jgi:undecaprenyl phosphate N,N'-diacetylbacillosamine 1-phosphate transferase